MENIVLTIHLILALALVGIVLLQRSEGGGLGWAAAAAVMELCLDGERQQHCPKLHGY